MAQTQNDPLAQLATDLLAARLARYKPHRAHLARDESTLVQQQPAENPTNHRYRNVILTNALVI